MRVKGGIVTRRRHKKILKANKGYRMTKSKLYKVGHEAYMHAGQYSYDHRRRRPSQMRRLWIIRLSAGANANGLKYKELMQVLKTSKIEINRKVLAEIVVDNPEVFTKIVEKAKNSK